MTTVDTMIRRRVQRGANEAQSRELLDSLLASHAGDNLAAALVYEGFATERQAYTFVATGAGDDE